MTTRLLRRGQVLQEGGFAVADVLLVGELIRAVGPCLPVPEDAEVWDLAGDLVVPGLVNAHTHSPDNLNTARLPQAPLELWSLASVPSRDGTPEELRLAAQLGAAQMLRGGVTGVVDMVRPAGPLALEALDAIADGYLQAGMRAAVVPVVRDLPVRATLPFMEEPSVGAEDDALDPLAQLGVVEAFWRTWHDRGGLIRVQVGPSGPQRCSDMLLQAAIGLARHLGTMLHTHAVETAPQARQARRRWDKSLVAHLSAIGGLTASTVLAHLAWPEPADLSLIAAAGAVVVHNPASNCALGSGRAPLPDLLHAGVRLALGTDAATCNDGLSLFEAMKWATILHRPHESDWRRWPQPAHALRMATEGGAAALGLDDRLGRVAPGYLADLAILDHQAAAFIPPNDLPRQLVMRASPETVRHVLVAGRPVVRERQLLTLAWSALAAAATERAANRHDVALPPSALAEDIERMLLTVRAEAYA